jgi:succinyl-diaminopimelate desuccinylase
VRSTSTAGLARRYRLVDRVGMEIDVVALTRRLVRAASENPPGAEAAAVAVLVEQAQRCGLPVTTQRVADDRVNVVVRLPGGGAAPALVYCGHLDTVPAGASGWTADPFGGEVRDGHVWGRGAVDMKGGLAAMLASLAALRDARLPGDLVLAAVVGEEVDCAGSRHLDGTDALDGAGWLVVGEPTGLDLVVAHKGAIRVEVVVRGRAAHGAHPDRGANAVVAMARLIAGLAVFGPDAPTHPLLGAPTASVNTVHGGTAINVVPEGCRAVIDIRTVPGVDVDAVLATVDEAADPVRGGGIGVDVELMHVRDPVGTAPDHPLVIAAQRVATDTLGGPRPVRGAAFYSDASVLAPPRDLPTLLFGPGAEELMHQPDERVAVADLHRATRFLTALPTALFGG